MTNLPRRQLIKATAVGAAGVVLLPADMAAAAKPTRDPLARSRFLPELGKGFTFASGATTWTGTLRAVDDLQSSTAPGDERRFELTFDWAGTTHPDGTYRVSRPGFAATDLFCVSTASGGRGAATVNRL